MVQYGVLLKGGGIKYFLGVVKNCVQFSLFFVRWGLFYIPLFFVRWGLFYISFGLRWGFGEGLSWFWGCFNIIGNLAIEGM